MLFITYFDNHTKHSFVYTSQNEKKLKSVEKIHQCYKPLKLYVKGLNRNVTVYLKVKKILKFKFKAKIVNFTVVHLWNASCLCMCSQFFHHTLITCTIDSVLAPFLHMLTYFTTQLPFQKWQSQGRYGKLILSKIFFKFLKRKG